MTERITRANVEERVNNLNRRVTEHGSNIHYEAQGRNGYVGLDRFDADGAMISNVMVGTTREVADFLHAAMVVLDDLYFYAADR